MDWSHQNNGNGQSNLSNQNHLKGDEKITFLPQHGHYRHLRVYQVTEMIYDITFYFTQRYLSKGDRTVDQMVQAARSGKQNIVEGSADGVTSMEMEIKLMNVARSSIQELREDYEDYLTARNLPIWTSTHPRFERMLKYCREHNQLGDYQSFFQRWGDEEMANIAISLCHFVDKMMDSYQKKLEKDFITEGGIKERMTAARLGYRTNQKEEIENLQRELTAARQELERLKKRQRI